MIGRIEKGYIDMRSGTWDAVIIGAGIAGTAVAYQLARYDLDVLIVERRSDVASEVSSANSGIVHAGYDPTPGTQMAHYNVRGQKLFPLSLIHI